MRQRTPIRGSVYWMVGRSVTLPLKIARNAQNHVRGSVYTEQALQRASVADGWAGAVLQRNTLTHTHLKLT